MSVGWWRGFMEKRLKINLLGMVACQMLIEI
jgi:hypothetical protein